MGKNLSKVEYSNQKSKKVSKKLSNEDLEELEKKTYCKLFLNRQRFLIRQILVNRKELRKWYKDFVRDCPNGELKLEEFQNIYKQFFPNGKLLYFNLFNKTILFRKSIKICSICI